MTERVAEQVRRLLHEQPELEVVFTDALTADRMRAWPCVLRR